MWCDLPVKLPFEAGIELLQREAAIAVRVKLRRAATVVHGLACSMMGGPNGTFLKRCLTLAGGRFLLAELTIVPVTAPLQVATSVVIGTRSAPPLSLRNQDLASASAIGLTPPGLQRIATNCASVSVWSRFASNLVKAWPSLTAAVMMKAEAGGAPRVKPLTVTSYSFAD